jgi:hypothetical protein
MFEDLKEWLSDKWDDYLWGLKYLTIPTLLLTLIIPLLFGLILFLYYIILTKGISCD